jgi:hypothetical protein
MEKHKLQKEAQILVVVVAVAAYPALESQKNLLEYQPIEV